MFLTTKHSYNEESFMLCDQKGKITNISQPFFFNNGLIDEYIYLGYVWVLEILRENTREKKIKKKSKKN